MAEIKAVLFDKDGTLIDFERTFAPALASIIKTLSKDDASLQNELAKSVEFDFHLQKFAATSIVIAGSTTDIAEQFAPILIHDLIELTAKLDEMFSQETPKHIAPFKGLDETMAKLDDMGLHLGVATNDNKENAKLHMQIVDLADRFTFFAGYNSGYGAKPAPGMILAFADKLNILPSQIAMVGDSTHDLITAKNAGAVGIGVTTGIATKADLIPHADHILTSINELPTFLKALKA